MASSSSSTEGKALPQPQAETETLAKHDAAEENDPLTESEKAIKAQLEYYFSDSNFRRDKFMKVQASSNAEGYIPIQVLLTFKRLQKLGANVMKMQRCASASDDIVLSPEGDKIKRARPLPSRDDSKDRTLLARGIPIECGDVDTLLEHFGRGRLVSVRMRRNNNIFTGQAFVEYKTQEQAVAAKEESLQINGSTITFQRLREFLRDLHVKRKAEEEAQKKRKRSKDAEEQSSTAESESVVSRDDPLVPGSIISVQGVPESMRRQEVQALFRVHGPVKFVLLRKSERCIVYMGSQSTASSAIEAINKGTVPETKTLCATVLAGVEETEAHQELRQILKNMERKNNKKKKGRKRQRVRRD